MLFSLTPNQMKNASNTENTYKPEISTITGIIRLLGKKIMC